MVANVKKRLVYASSNKDTAGNKSEGVVSVKFSISIERIIHAQNNAPFQQTCVSFILAQPNMNQEKIWNILPRITPEAEEALAGHRRRERQSGGEDAAGLSLVARTGHARR